jgi:hypothetical protein
MNGAPAFSLGRAVIYVFYVKGRMGKLSKDQALHISGVSFRETTVEFPELGGDVDLRQLSAGKRAKLLNGLIDAEGSLSDVAHYQARLISATCVDPRFTVQEARELMDEWPATLFDRLLEAVNGLSGEPEEVKAAAAGEFREAND